MNFPSRTCSRPGPRPSLRSGSSSNTPLRVALNPFVSTAGYLLSYLVSGSIIVSMVMSLSTVVPVLLSALMDQDLYLAGPLVLLVGVLTVAGTLISDLLLLGIDPRIRFRGTL